MCRQSCLLFTLLLAALAPLHAQSIVIEPPAPASYSEDRPAFMFFKKVEITPRPSGSYDVVITLQGDLPSTFPKGRGANFSMNFDFAEIQPELALPTNIIPNFYHDLIVSVGRGVGESKFEARPTTLDFRKREWEFRIFNLSARKDTISFSLRSPFFSLHLPAKVAFFSNYMKAISPTQSSGDVAHHTDAVSLDLPGTTPPK